MQADSSNINEQLLKDFMPDDVYPVSAQLVAETSGQTYQLGSKELAEVGLWTVIFFVCFDRSESYFCTHIPYAG